MARPSFTIAIQARMGSTRLPGKMSRPFFRQQTILELILEELTRNFGRSCITVATTAVAADDEIASLAEDAGVRCWRGSEDDVLGRVCEAVQDDDAQYIVRVCADNPFLRADYVVALLEECHSSQYDYVSYALPDGTPTILSHLGLFAEAIRHRTLATINATATAERHREHLTSHILDFPDQYARQLLPIPAYVADLESVRLTVDTESDFRVCQQLYESVRLKFGADFSGRQLVEILRARPDLHKLMAEQILANEKR